MPGKMLNAGSLIALSAAEWCLRFRCDGL